MGRCGHGKCCLSTHGGDRTVSPFLIKELPNVVWDAKKMNFSEEEAYNFCWPLSTGKHHGEYIVEEHAMLQKEELEEVIYFAVQEGASGVVWTILRKLGA